MLFNINVEENKINFEKAKENIVFNNQKSLVSIEVPILKVKGIMNRNIDENNNIFNNYDNDINYNEEKKKL